jgi:hypothetical protein
MGLLSQLILVPLAPARAAWWTIGQVVDQAARDYYGPATIRSELAELSRRLDDGLISADEFDLLEDELLDRLAEGQRQGLS